MSVEYHCEPALLYRVPYSLRTTVRITFSVSATDSMLFTIQKKNGKQIYIRVCYLPMHVKTKEMEVHYWPELSPASSVELLSEYFRVSTRWYYKVFR